MFHPAKLNYCGLTIVMSNPSRFDLKELISGNAGCWFNNECLRPEVNRWMCDIYDLKDYNNRGRKVRDGTKVCLLLGETTMQEVAEVSTTLGEQRGSPISKGGLVSICSYLPQDCFDFKDYESYLNPALNGEGSAEETYEKEDSTEGNEKSRHGKTARSNWRYWLKHDCKKALRILKHGITQYEEPTFNIYPSSEEVIEVLRSYENTDFYLDIETDSDLNITCLGFSFGSSNVVYVIPIIRYNYTVAYSSIGSIFRSVAYAMSRNTTVAHNGSGFDFFVLPYKYRIPIGARLYDTMIASHRCFPEIESLARRLYLYPYL